MWRFRLPSLVLVFGAACGSFTGDSGGAPVGGGDASTDAMGAADGAVSGEDGSSGSGDAGTADGAKTGDGGAAHCAWDAPFTDVEQLNLNSSLGEGTPRLSHDELALYFFRNDGTNKSDLYVATRADISQQFSNPTPLSTINTTAYDELDPFLSDDDLTLYFTSDRGRGGPVTPPFLQLYVATRSSTAGTFGGVTLMNVNVPTARDETAGYVASNGDLWFTRDDPGGSADIWLAPFSKANGFGVPAIVASLSTALNDEAYPVVSSDRLTVYFFTSQDTGQGSYQVNVAHRSGVTDAFGAPAPLGYLAPQFDGGGGSTRPSWISDDECRLYAFSFTATMDGDHMYVASRKPK